MLYAEAGPVGSTAVVAANNSSPATVIDGSTLYAYFIATGTGAQPASLVVWESSATPGSFWSQPAPVTGPGSLTTALTCVLASTSPSAAVYSDSRYLFYIGCGDNGIWYSTNSEDSWSGVTQLSIVVSGIGVRAATSPATAVYKNQLYLFYTGSGGDGFWFTVLTVNGSTSLWKPIQRLAPLATGLNVLSNATASLVVFNNLLYVFGATSDGISYTTFDGSTWTTAQEVPDAPSANPSAFFAAAVSKLGLSWATPDGGIEYALFDGMQWASPVSLDDCMPAPAAVSPSTTSPSVIEFQGQPYFVWNDTTTGVSYSTWRTLTIGPNLAEILTNITAGNGFLLSFGGDVGAGEVCATLLADGSLTMSQDSSQAAEGDLGISDIGADIGTELVPIYEAGAGDIAAVGMVITILYCVVQGVIIVRHVQRAIGASVDAFWSGLADEY